MFCKNYSYLCHGNKKKERSLPLQLWLALLVTKLSMIKTILKTETFLMDLILQKFGLKVAFHHKSAVFIGVKIANYSILVLTTAKYVGFNPKATVLSM